MLCICENVVVQAQARSNHKQYEQQLASFLWHNSGFRDWQAFIEVYYMGNDWNAIKICFILLHIIVLAFRQMSFLWMGWDGDNVCLV